MTLTSGDFATLGREMHELATELFPITRSLAGPGFRESLDRLERVTGPMERHRFATGERVYDWTVPREWHIRDAWIEGPDGSRVVQMSDSNLHLVSYSSPVDARMSLDELQPHLYSMPEHPDWIPYRTTYYEENWGFCLTDRQRRRLEPGEYRVRIDSELVPGHVELGEVTVEGETDTEVLLSTYCCHPSMANNELSGPVLVAHLARLMRERPERPRFTYRFLFVPETIGAICYLARFGERLLRRLAAGYVVTCIGDPRDFNYKLSRRGDSLADRAALHVLQHAGKPYRVLDYYPAGSDERQYCSPGFNLPVGSLMRSTWDQFPEYHTSADDLSFVTADALGESLEMYYRIVEALEAAETFCTTVPYCEPQLSPRGLYPTTGALRNVAQSRRDMMFLLNWCDGQDDLLAGADRIERPIWVLRPIVDKLVGHDLLSRVAGSCGEPDPSTNGAASHVATPLA
jgi:aminopeptidase-like protein